MYNTSFTCFVCFKQGTLFFCLHKISVYCLRFFQTIAKLCTKSFPIIKAERTNCAFMKGEINMKKIISLSLALVLMLTVVACKKEEPPIVSEVESDIESIISEVEVKHKKEFTTLEEALAELPFTPKVLTLMPEGYELTNIYIIDEHMLELRYTFGENELTYRTAKGDWDISGDYDFIYKEEEFEEVDDIRVFVRGEDGLIKTAVWWVDEHSYALTGNTGVDFDDLKLIIRGVQ